MTDEEFQAAVQAEVDRRLNAALQEMAVEQQRILAKAVADASENTAALFEQQAVDKIAELFTPDEANNGLLLTQDTGSGYTYALVEVSRILHNPKSLRTPEELDPQSEGIQALAADIQGRGALVRPLLVYRLKEAEEGYYRLVKGARRLAAMHALGEELVQAYVLPVKPPLGMEEIWVNGY